MSSGDWNDYFNFPVWSDHGARVEIEWDDGSRTVGKLDYEDMTPGPDEWPIYFVVTDDGARREISELKRWRRVSDP